jgi:hypothetical protein
LGGETEWCDSEAGESDAGDEYEVETDEAAADEALDADDEARRELLGCDCDCDDGDEFDGCLGPPWPALRVAESIATRGLALAVPLTLAALRWVVEDAAVAARSPAARSGRAAIRARSDCAEWRGADPTSNAAAFAAGELDMGSIDEGDGGDDGGRG